MRYVFGIAACLILLLALPTVAQGTPTPTPTPLPSLTPTQTLRPIQSTPTSSYQYLRITPTPLPLTPAPLPAEFDLTDASGNFADTVINMYRGINSLFGIGDMLSFFVVGLFVVLLLVRTLKRLNKDD
ncbi:MAG: hypothetical protein DYG88_07250 [Chloroflexi bacterium CFX4]|nr:hypothetical protein [Chloroflexi bacterium CFX4]MDL1921990.1 hypothetical protein [Chloroflexi bacterium CFX3]